MAKRAVGLVLYGLVVACGGESNAGLTPDGRGGDWNIVISPASLTLVQGQTGTLTISIVGNLKSAASLSLVYLPDSVTGTFSSQVLSNSSATSTLTIRAGAKAPTGTNTIYINSVDGNGDKSGLSFSLTVTPAPGVTVTRLGSGSGTVTSSPAGINCGNACTTQFPIGTPLTLTAAPAAGSVFSAWAGACTGTAVTCTFTPVPNNANTVTATFNSTAPGIALAVAPSPVVVQQGTSATATATITRINGFAAPVTLTANAPGGLAVTVNPTNVTGTTSTLTFSAGASLAAGNYPVTITATGSGVSQQTLTLPVQVTPASQGGAITFNFATCETSEIPVWLAVQNGNGPWTRVTPANNAFTFTPGATTGLAMVTQDGTTTLTQVLYASGAELTSLAIAGFCAYSAPTGTKRITGPLANAGSVAQNTTRVSVGGAEFTRPSDPIQSFTLTNVPKGNRDLVAAKQASVINQSRMILRRGTNYANNANIPLLDFGSAESFTPVINTVAISNYTDSLALEASLITTNGSSSPYYFGGNTSAPGGGARASFFGLPDTLLQAGDFHSISVFGGSPTSFRFVQLLTHSVTAKGNTFGPLLSSNTKITTLGTTPYLRVRAQIPALTSYTSAANVEVSQNANSVAVLMTAGYVGAAPTTWTLDVPDLSSAGYDASWAIKSGVGVSWGVTAVSALNGNLLPFIGGAPVDNAQLTGAGMADSTASFSASLRPLTRWRPHD